MRRKDREVTDYNRIYEIVSNCDYCRLGLADEGRVYIVPLNYGFSVVENQYTFYFHGAKEGHKIDLMKKTHYAGFEMDTEYKLIEGEKACDHSALFQSVIGEGTISFIEQPGEKKKALCLIMEHNTGKSDWEIPEAMLNATCVYQLKVEQMSCKEHL